MQGNTKARAIELIRRLPENVTLNDIASELDFHARRERSLDGEDEALSPDAEDFQTIARLLGLDRVTDPSPLYDLLYELYLRAAIEEGREDIRNGRVLSHDEVMKEMREWVESSGQ